MRPPLPPRAAVTGSSLRARLGLNAHGEGVGDYMNVPTQGPVPQVWATVPVVKNWISCAIDAGWTRSSSCGSPQLGIGFVIGQRLLGGVFVSGAGRRPQLHSTRAEPSMGPG